MLHCLGHRPVLMVLANMGSSLTWENVAHCTAPRLRLAAV
jgi:hypothetical protein